MGNFLTARWNNMLSIVLGVLAAGLFIFVLTGVNVSLSSGSMTSLIVLVVVGLVACVVGNAHSATKFGWTSSTYWANPISIIGMVLGIAALILFAFTLSGINIPLTTAFIVLGF